MWEIPDDPRTEESALAWARNHVPEPDLILRHRHPDFDSDDESGGFAFTTPNRLVLVGRHRSVSVQVLGSGADIDAIIDDWLRAERRRNRSLADDELGPCQQAALRLLADDVAPLDVRATLAREFGEKADLDAATYLWIRMRQALARGSDAHRELASNDELLEGRGTPGSLLVTACPVCGAPAVTMPRYPRAVCDECFSRTACVHGRLVHGYNTAMSGGFAAEHVDRREPVACDETTRSGDCWIGDAPCRIGEAHLGGVVVEAR